MRRILLAVMATTLALPACGHRAPTREEIYNSWKGRCYELSAFYHDRIRHPPYHMIAEHEADLCSTPDPAYQWEADARNLDILVTNLFYNHDLKNQRQALELLEHYQCQDDHSCGTLADLLDANVTKSLPLQSPAWRGELHPRVRDFGRHLQDLR